MIINTIVSEILGILLPYILSFAYFYLTELLLILIISPIIILFVALRISMSNKIKISILSFNIVYSLLLLPIIYSLLLSIIQNYEKILNNMYMTSYFSIFSPILSEIYRNIGAFTVIYVIIIAYNFIIIKKFDPLRILQKVTLILMLLPILNLLIYITLILGIEILGIYSLSIIPTMSNLAISQHKNILINITSIEISAISQGKISVDNTYVLFAQQMYNIEYIVLQDIIKDLTNTIIDGIIFISIIIYFYIRHLKHKTIAK